MLELKLKESENRLKIATDGAGIGLEISLRAVRSDRDPGCDVINCIPQENIPFLIGVARDQVLRLRLERDILTVRRDAGVVGVPIAPGSSVTRLTPNCVNPPASPRRSEDRPAIISA